VLGPVPSGLPRFGFPQGVSWGDASGLLVTSVSLFLVILAQSAATSRAYAVKYGEKFVENDDLLGLSAANLAAGLTSTFVVNGSPTKTEIVDDARSRTQVAQLTTAAVVLLVLLFLTKPLQYLPVAVLSAVVFLIGLQLVDLASMRQIWRLRREEFVVAAITAVVVVCVGVEQGIVLAIVLSLILHVRRHYTPRDAVIVWDEHGRVTLVPPEPGVESEPGLVVYRFAVGLFYANAELFADEVRGLAEGAVSPRWIVLDLGAVDDIDYTGGETFVELVEELLERKIVVAVAEPAAGVRRELDAFGVTERIGRERVYATVGDARDAFRQGKGAAS